MDLDESRTEQKREREPYGLRIHQFGSNPRRSSVQSNARVEWCRWRNTQA